MSVMHHGWCPRLMPRISLTQDRSALVSATPLASAWHWRFLEPEAGHMLDETACSHELGLSGKREGVMQQSGMPELIGSN